ncbi:MAG: hypothetical protein ACLPSL_04270 [Smithella sp.]
MKNHIKQVIAAVLLLLMVAALPIIFRAEEQKPDEDKVMGEMDLSVLIFTAEQL